MNFSQKFKNFTNSNETPSSHLNQELLKSKNITDSNIKKENEKKLEKYKQTLKTFRKSLAILVKDIKTELDIFQVCFSADLESFNLKLNQTQDPPKPVTSGIIVSEEYHSENPDSDIHKNSENTESIVEENTEIIVEENTEIIVEEDQEFSRIKFQGIAKKKKPRK